MIIPGFPQVQVLHPLWLLLLPIEPTTRLQCTDHLELLVLQCKSLLQRPSLQ